MSDQPNLLWLTIEDTSPQFLGCYGDAAARTPAMDALARSGHRFTRAYSTGTVCSPSRSTLITGVPCPILGTGHHRSAYPIPEQIVGFPSVLRGLGYYTSNNVKTDYNTSAHDRLVAESWNESSERAGWWGRDPDQPFFSVFNFMQSHESRTMSMPYDLYAELVLRELDPDRQIGAEAFAVPPFLRDSPDMRRQLARVYNSLSSTDQQLGAVLDRLASDGHTDNTIVMMFADHGEAVPRGKTNGIGFGYRVPLIISVPERWRHLAPWAPGETVDELVSFADLAPTLIGLAGGDPPAHMAGRQIMGAGRAEPPRYRYGATDRADETTDLERSVFFESYVYSRHFMPYQPELSWLLYHDISDIQVIMRQDLADGLLNPAQARLFAPRPMESLYDLDADPWEQRNLADEPGYATLAEELRGELDRHLLADRDVMFCPEPELARISEHTTPYAYRQSARYPFEDVYAAARLAGRVDQLATDEQLGLLGHSEPMVRYWAAIGLRCLTGPQLGSVTAALERALDDDYPPVRILAAAALWRALEDERALEVLRSGCLSNDPYLALIALQQVQHCEDLSPFARQITAVADTGASRSDNVASITGVLLWRMGRTVRPLPANMRPPTLDRSSSPHG